MPSRLGKFCVAKRGKTSQKRKAKTLESLDYRALALLANGANSFIRAKVTDSLRLFIFEMNAD